MAKAAACTLVLVTMVAMATSCSSTTSSSSNISSTETTTMKMMKPKNNKKKSSMAEEHYDDDDDYFNLRLEYYAHIEAGASGLVRTEVSGSSSNSSSNNDGFGLLQVLDAPLTILPNLSSQLVGAERCVAAITHADANSSSLQYLHLCTDTYSHAAFHGTFIVQGEANILALQQGWELAITGGTGDFRGATGYTVGSIYSDADPDDQILHYVAHIHLPTSSSKSPRRRGVAAATE